MLFELLAHLLHNDHGERAMLIPLVSDAAPFLRVWLGAWVRS